MVLRNTKKSSKGRPPSVTGFVPSSNTDSSISTESSVPIFTTTNQDSQKELKETASGMDFSEDNSSGVNNSTPFSPSKKSSTNSLSASFLEEEAIETNNSSNEMPVSASSSEPQNKPDQDKVSETSTSVEEPVQESSQNTSSFNKTSATSVEENNTRSMDSPVKPNVSYKDALLGNDEEHEASSTKSKSKSRIEFAPWNVPLVRRRQTLAHVLSFCLSIYCQILFFICVLVPLTWPFFIPYIFYIYRDESFENGSRVSSWYRNLPIWRWYADFYPTRIVKEADLDPSKNYIFGYHPHGIISMGAFTNFGTNGTGVDKVFPNIFVHCMTLASNLKIPFYREHLLSLGVVSVSKQSIRNILGKGPGSSCLIVIGGAEESLEAKPDRAHLILAHRYGFVKMAMQCGADLVPVFGFGENQLYDQVDNEHGSWIYYFQQKVKKFAGFTVPLFNGRGIFIYNLGVFPRRVPLTVVTGAPIPVTKCDKPTDEQVQELHKKYIEALTDLYDRNKSAYWIGSDPPELKIC